MKKFTILSAMTTTMIMAVHPVGDAGHALDGTHEADVPAIPTVVTSFGDALQKGKFTAKTRTFYMKRTFDDGGPDTTALTFGGIFKYESGNYNGLKFGLAYYGSHSLFGIFDRYEGANPHGGTSLLERNTGEDLAFLGEAYLQYDMSNTMVKVGRQQLATPLMQNHDLRLLPSVYEAAIIRNKDIQDTMIEIGYVKRYTGFTSKDNRFLDQNTKWGKDGLAYISFSNKSIENLALHGQYIKAIADTANDGSPIAIDDYKYLDFTYNLPFGTKTYIKGQYGGNAYASADDSTLLGAKIGTTVYDMVDVAVLYDKISGNEFKAVESGPMYSDWQQGYSNYEESTAFGGQIIIRPMSDLSLKFGYVDVRADAGKNRDDFTEFNFDGKYTINNYSKLRVRYSIKDQTPTSSREDRNDFRIIYYMNF